ncbi:unnamed protein product [Tuber aestivum]|uniref:Mitochondrial import inner membrane translocase subunit n=1 Tax=Tuber aestivum TaxID=59557 RepID=A0A292PTT6_9PEZI|nr:unnamed protein product [Tuber aestivum]
MDNIGNMLGLGTNSTKEERKQALMSTIAQQSNIENARTLIEKINEKCFEKCVPKPGRSLSSGESVCSPFPLAGEGADGVVVNIAVGLLDGLHAEVYAGLERCVPSLYF